MKGWIALGGSITGILSGLVVAWVTVDPWPRIGWITPNQMDAHIAAEAEDRKRLKFAIAQIELLFECVEWEEMLDQKLHQQADGDTSPELAEDIRRLRKKIDDNNCAKFDD